MEGHSTYVASLYFPPIAWVRIIAQLSDIIGVDKNAA